MPALVLAGQLFFTFSRDAFVGKQPHHTRTVALAITLTLTRSPTRTLTLTLNLTLTFVGRSRAYPPTWLGLGNPSHSPLTLPLTLPIPLPLPFTRDGQHRRGQHGAQPARLREAQVNRSLAIAPWPALESGLGDMTGSPPPPARA